MAQSTVNAMVCGSVAGSVSTIAVAPFDFVKVRLQTQSLSLRQILAQDRNIIQFFRGTTPALVCAVLENSVVFGANATLKNVWKNINVNNTWTQEGSYVESAILGGLSGVFSACVISPAETIKIRLQHTSSSKTVQHCVQTIFREEGVLALFQGLPAQLPRDVLFNFVFFPAFELSCETFRWMRGVHATKNDLSVGELVFAGGVAGAAGWTLTLPFDVVKSQTQARKKTVATDSSLKHAGKMVKDIFRESGVRGFFRGWGAATARAFPVNGVLFASYSLTERMIERM